MNTMVDLDFATRIRSTSPDIVEAEISKINQNWTSRFSFPELNAEIKKSLSESLVAHLDSNNNAAGCHKSCLEFVRLMSRDKTNLDSFVSDELIKCLVKFAKYDGLDLSSGINYATIIEAQKCLCNLTFQNEKARRFCCDSNIVESLCQRIFQQANENPVLNFDVKFYDLRLLFLITALCADVRPQCRNSTCNVQHSLVRVLEQTSKIDVLNDQNVDLITENLKVSFNVLMSYKLAQLQEDEKEFFVNFTALMRNLLLHKTETVLKGQELKNNTVNLLTTVPSDCYIKLAPEVANSNDISNTMTIYDGHDVSAVDALLNFLDERLDKPYHEQKDSLSPILTLLTDMSRGSKFLRRYMRYKVLPPLRDVSHRPEEGTTLRNRLVKIMTSVTDVNFLAAEFLFQLCKCSVDRLIKYTGFGNAAGLLSNLGLLAGAKNREASSEEENSDTEEYLKARSNINPVLGCTEKPKSNPMDGMTEEQKEYEAMKLVEEINKLMSSGVVVPGRVGEDGKVHPIEHVLQMREQSDERNKENEENEDDD